MSDYGENVDIFQTPSHRSDIYQKDNCCFIVWVTTAKVKIVGLRYSSKNYGQNNIFGNEIIMGL
jgi:hypothetical protein